MIRTVDEKEQLLDGKAQVVRASLLLGARIVVEKRQLRIRVSPLTAAAPFRPLFLS
jgi:hypothetical protein